MEGSKGILHTVNLLFVRSEKGKKEEMNEKMKKMSARRDLVDGIKGTTRLHRRRGQFWFLLLERDLRGLVVNVIQSGGELSN